MRFYEPFSGDLLIDDQNMAERSVSFARDRFAYAEEDVPVLTGMIRDNVALTAPIIPPTSSTGRR